MTPEVASTTIVYVPDGVPFGFGSGWDWLSPVPLPQAIKSADKMISIAKLASRFILLKRSLIPVRKSIGGISRNAYKTEGDCSSPARVLDVDVIAKVVDAVPLPGFS